MALARMRRSERAEIPLFNFQLRGIWAIAGIAVLGIAAFAYNQYRRSSLEREAGPQVEDFLRREVLFEAARAFKEGRPPPRDLGNDPGFEILAVDVPFIPSNEPYVRVRVRRDGKEETRAFRFRRTLGSWRLLSEVRLLLPGR